MNVAARIQQMASPGAVLVSGDVKRAIRSGWVERLKPQGSVRLDKMTEILPVFALAPATGGRAKGRRRDLRLLMIAAGVLALGLLGAGLWLARGSLPWGTPRPARVAIAPFEIAANDPTLREFVDVMTDRTVEVLTANQVPTTTTRPADGAGHALAGTPEADYLLKGSVRRDDQMLRVTAKLEDVHGRVVLWSAEMARPLGDTHAFQVQAASRFANILECVTEVRQRPHAPRESETLSLFLQLCEASFSPKDLGQMEQALTLARRFAEQAPGFSIARSNLAWASAFMSNLFPAGQKGDLRRTAQIEADRALKLDPKNSQAYGVLAMLAPPDQWAQREALLSRAVSVDPNGMAGNNSYGSFLSEVGRLQDSLVYLQKAAAQDSLDPGMAADAALGLARTGQFGIANETLQQALQDWPDDKDALGSRFYLARWEGRFDVALSMLQGDGDVNRGLSDAERKSWRDVLSALGSHDARRMAGQRDAQIALADRGGIDLSFAIENLSQLGLVDDAFALAERLPGLQIPINNTLLFNPTTAPMRRDRRFIALADKLGLVDYWRSTGKWPDFCAENGLPYDCKAEAAKYPSRAHG